MNRYKVIILTVILIVSLAVLVDKIFTTAPINIILESGEEVTTQDSNYYTSGEVVLLIICAFLIGLSVVLIYYSSDGAIKEYFLPEKKERLVEDKSHTKVIINLLKGDERTVYQEILNSKDGILQNELVLRTGLSKVKITRVIHRLELKRLIVKERHGLTNRIKLKEN